MFNETEQLKKIVASDLIMSYISTIKKQLGQLSSYMLSENITHEVSKNNDILIEVYNKIHEALNV